MSIWFIVAAFLAEVVGTMAGFGSSTILLPVALFFMDFKAALVIVAMFHVVGNIGRVCFFWRKPAWDILVWFGITSVLFTIVGAWMVQFLSTQWFFLILGLFLVGFSVVSFCKPTVTLQQNKKNQVIGGSVSGFLAGLLGTGGAFRAVVVQSYKLKKEQYIVTMAIMAIVVDITRLPVYLQEGFLPRELYASLPVLVIVAIFGVYVGKRVVVSISQKLFERMVLGAIFVIGLKFFLQGIGLI